MRYLSSMTLPGPDIGARQSMVYMQSQVAEILGMPLAQIKNWTIGRPIEISPSLRARGTGSRNLYDNDDLYKFAAAAHLYADGLSARAIQAVLDSAGHHLRSLAFVILRSSPYRGASTNDEFEVMQIPDAHARGERKRWIRLLRTSISGHVLNVAAIKDETDRHIAEFWEHSGTNKGRRARPERRETPIRKFKWNLANNREKK